MKLPSMNCKNCEQVFEGNFCNNCGQESSVSRLDYKYLINEITASIFQLNRGFLFTVKELFIRPGHSIREFIGGKRIQHYKPIAFYLVTTAIYVLSAYLMNRNTFMADLISGFINGMADNDQSSGLDILNWISQNQTYISILFVPFFSLASYFAFIKYKYNYIEHIVLNLFISGQQMLIYLILSFVFFKENFLLIIPVLVGMLFNVWSYYQFFNKKKKFSKALLVLLTYFLFIVILIVLFLIIAGIVTIFYKYY